MKLPRTSLKSQRFADTLFVGIVCLNASLAILRKDFGDLDNGVNFIQWYVLAFLYVVASWRHPANGEVAPWASPLASWSLIAGSFVCIVLAVKSGASPTELSINWVDWAVMSLIYGTSAYGMRAASRQ